MKKFIKRVARGLWGLFPRSLKNAIRNVFSQLAGTREIRDSFRHIYGDYTVYEELLKGKSDVTEYHVDKMIRSVGKELVELKRENQDLKKRVAALENTKGKRT
jgi:hypothetical protein